MLLPLFTVIYLFFCILWKVQEAQRKDTSKYIKIIIIFSPIDRDQISWSSVVVILPLKQSVANTHKNKHIDAQ